VDLHDATHTWFTRVRVPLTFLCKKKGAPSGPFDRIGVDFQKLAPA
jgi:hypothetical protein